MIQIDAATVRTEHHLGVLKESLLRLTEDQIG